MITTPAGRMISSGSNDNFASRFHDGSGKEIKRQSFSRVETETTSYWEFREIKYYVRSSVLGGELVSEVDGTGGKLKTIVRAAGATLAYQYGYGVAESVMFEYADASGMSSRRGDRTGFVFAGDGGESSPVETDPMGGNVGASTPYIEVLPPYQPPEEFPMLQSYS